MPPGRPPRRPPGRPPGGGRRRVDLPWLTYDEMAEVLGLTRESARVLARQKRWSRKPGNDRRARVGVPEEEVSSRSPPPEEVNEPPRSPPRGAPPKAPRKPPPGGNEALTLEVAVLKVRCASLEARVEDLVAERDKWASMAQALVKRPWLRWPWSKPL